MKLRTYCVLQPCNAIRDLRACILVELFEIELRRFYLKMLKTHRESKLLSALDNSNNNDIKEWVRMENIDEPLGACSGNVLHIRFVFANSPYLWFVLSVFFPAESQNTQKPRAIAMHCVEIWSNLTIKNTTAYTYTSSSCWRALIRCWNIGRL